MKTKKLKIENPEQLATALGELRTREAAINKSTARVEAFLAAMKLRHTERMADDIKSYKALAKACLAYLGKHPEQVLTAPAKSAVIADCLVGLRWNPHKVVLLDPEDDWVHAADRLWNHPLGKSYVRIADPEVNKERIIEHRSTVPWLFKLGLDVVQEEVAFIDTQLAK